MAPSGNNDVRHNEAPVTPGDAEIGMQKNGRFGRFAARFGRKETKMADAQSTPSTVQRGWSEVLSVMERATAHNIERACQRDEALASLGLPAPLPAADHPVEWQQAFEQSKIAHHDFEACFQAAQHWAADLESAFAATEESLADWLATAESVRRRLANWGNPSV
jgi:hypothetical protein